MKILGIIFLLLAACGGAVCAASFTQLSENERNRMETEHVLARSQELLHPTGSLIIDPILLHEARAARNRLVGGSAAGSFGVLGLICLAIGFEISRREDKADRRSEKLISELHRNAPAQSSDTE